MTQHSRATRGRLAALGWVAALVTLMVPSLPLLCRAADPVLDLLRLGTRNALGLGGDPFLSPIDDGAGWWGAPRLQTRPALSMGMEGRELLSRRLTRDQGAFTGSELYCAGATAGHLGHRSWLAAGRAIWRRRTADWHGGRGGLSLDAPRPQAQWAVRTLECLPGLHAQLTGTVEKRDRALGLRDHGLGLRYSPNGWLKLQGSWERSRMQDRLLSDFYEIPWSASVNLRRDTATGDGRIALPRGLYLEGGFSETVLHGVDGLSSAPSYQLFPAGSLQDRQVSLLWRTGTRVGFLLRRSLRKTDIKGRAAWGGERFGQLTYARADLKSDLVGVELRPSARVRWILDAEVARATGKGRAEIEFWPFTPTLIDLLGQERIYRGDFAADWFRGHIGREWSSRRGSVKTRCGLNWFDLHPSLTVKSWRPTFLVFGLSDERWSRLAIHRVQLASLALGCDLPAGPFRAALDVEQIVYGRSMRSASSAGGVSSTGQAGPGGGSKGITWTRRPGGSQASLSLTRVF